MSRFWKFNQSSVSAGLAKAIILLQLIDPLFWESYKIIIKPFWLLAQKNNPKFNYFFDQSHLKIT